MDREWVNISFPPTLTLSEPASPVICCTLHLCCQFDLYHKDPSWVQRHHRKEHAASYLFEVNGMVTSVKWSVHTQELDCANEACPSSFASIQDLARHLVIVHNARMGSCHALQVPPLPLEQPIMHPCQIVPTVKMESDRVKLVVGKPGKPEDIGKMMRWGEPECDL
ncbi:hypothetical protein C8J57DRAFT_1248030 [Mycena rebaudengoi]|nr:hypothetical protein C8J57DRAFT_1248030 [Mycena rebaudengoi]